MNVPAAFGAVDWGTSGFRLWLIGRDGAVIGTAKSRQGMTIAATEGFENILEHHLAALDAPADLPVIVCGMAGARQGWVEAGYADVPTRLDGLAAQTVKVGGISRDVRILPGLAQRDPVHADVMRGEETQLIGAFSQIGAGAHTICMPGTHSKWVSVDDGRVTGFSTYMTGELFAAISTGTILRHAMEGADSFDEAGSAFGNAVTAAFSAPGRATSQMFAIRARGLLFGANAADSMATLSGTMIGLELAGGLAEHDDASSLVLVAEGRLETLYRSALSHLGVTTHLINADNAVLAGLTHAANTLWPSARNPE